MERGQTHIFTTYVQGTEPLPPQDSIQTEQPLLQDATTVRRFHPKIGISPFLEHLWLFPAPASRLLHLKEWERKCVRERMKINNREGERERERAGKGKGSWPKRRWSSKVIIYYYWECTPVLAVHYCNKRKVPNSELRGQYSLRQTLSSEVMAESF